jgi:DNA repair protein RadC
MTYTIKELPHEERPRERLLKFGPESMASSELIAIILGSGMKGKSVLTLAKEIIGHFGSLSKIADATVEELCQIKGMGKAKAVQLKAAFSLGMKAARSLKPSKYRIDSPENAYQLVREELENEKREVFLVILLDTKAYHIRHDVVSIGSLSNTLVHPREVFYPAVRHKAASLLLTHNHPSGDPTPSSKDIAITKKLISVGEIMGIRVNDHIIIGKQSYISLRQRGVAFS